MSLEKEHQPVEMEEAIAVAGQASATDSVAGNNGVPTIQVNTPATLPEGSTLKADVARRKGHYRHCCKYTRRAAILLMCFDFVLSCVDKGVYSVSSLTSAVNKPSRSVSAIARTVSFNVFFISSIHVCSLPRESKRDRRVYISRQRFDCH
jgi:hypothetical protein